MYGHPRSVPQLRTGRGGEHGSAALGLVRRARDRHVWLLVGGICLLAAGVRVWAAMRVEAPWIMIDELVYRDLAASLAGSGRFAARGEPIGLVSLYPLVLAPLWKLASPAAAYEGAKLLNVVSMSAMSVLVFVWARRLVSQRWAVVATVLSLLLPAWVYTGELMTENLFMPAFLLAAFAIAVAIPDPTPRRQAVAIAVIALASAVRLQGLVLLPIWATAALLWTVLSPADGSRRTRAVASYAARYRPAAATGVLAAGGVAVAAAARGGHPSDLLGFYGGVVGAHYPVGGSLRWFAYHLAELSLACGLLPAAALLVLAAHAARRRSLPAPVAALVATTVAATFWLVLVAGVWAARHADGIRGRYLIYALPLLLLCFVAWLDSGLGVPRRGGVLAAAVACIAPIALPLHGLLGPKVLSDAPSLTGLRWIASGASLGTAELAFAAVATLAGVLFVARTPRGHAPALVAFVGCVLLANSVAAFALTAGEAGKVARGTAATAWVDRTVGAGGDVAILYTGNVAAMQLWQTEFWNRSVRRVYTLSGPEPGTLPTAQATVGRGGRLTLADGRPLAADAIVTDTSVSLDSPVLARFPTGLVLYAYRPGTIAIKTFSGLYPDGWTGPTLTYTRPGCHGTARLVFAFDSDPSAPGPQEAVARQAGRVVARGSVAPGGRLYLRAPLSAGRGSCRLRIDITPWRRPGDTRVLGLHFQNVVTIP